MIVAASQVKWNKTKSSIIATSHDGDLKLWDIRKASTPFMYISAHIGRIFSLDWSSNCPDSLVTSSQDCFVKFFNVASQSSKGMCLYCKQYCLHPVCFTYFPEKIIGVIVCTNST